MSTHADEDHIDGVTYQQSKTCSYFARIPPGDYSQGSFFLLIDGKNDMGWGTISACFSSRTDHRSSGGVTLNAGEFLIAHDGDKDIQRYTPGSLGALRARERFRYWLPVSRYQHRPEHRRAAPGAGGYRDRWSIIERRTIAGVDPG